MRELNQQEQQLVDNNSKSASDLPRYFDATTGLDITITREFETWIIVTPVSTRSSIATWLQQLANNMPRSQVFDDLATVFAGDELNNAEDERDEYDNALNEYDQFRAQINTQGFEDVFEIGVLLNQTIEGLGRIGEAASSAQYMFAVATKLQNTLTDTSSSDTKRRSLLSWISVLMAYP